MGGPSKLTIAAVLVAAFIASPSAIAAETPDITFVDRSTGEWRGADDFYFGSPGDQPLVGDWDCDGYLTPGAYRSSDGFVYLRDTSDTGPADIRFFLGIDGDIALAGDFDGDGCDTVSIYRGSEGRVYIANTLGADQGFFAADASYYFGHPGDAPFAGDFDGDGIDTVGLHRGTTGFVYFTNDVMPDFAATTHRSFFYGDPGDRINVGDWDADGIDSVVIMRDGAVYLSNTNAQGPADLVISAPQGDWLFMRGVDPVPPGSIAEASPTEPPVSPAEPPVEPPVDPPVEPTPTGPIEVVAGDPLADLVHSSGPGTVFHLRAGVHLGHVMWPAAGMKFIGEPGAVLDGNGTNLNAFAGAPGVDGVEIRGLEIRNYRVAVFDGVISARKVGDLSQEGKNWIIADNDIHSNGGAGINLGSGMIVENNLIHDNQQIGISGLADEDDLLVDVTITGNQIYRNSLTPDYEFEHHEGGIKTIFTSGLSVLDNDLFDNGGVGVYCDIECRNVLIDNNRMYNNWGRANGGGVFLEISRDAIISNNYFGSGGHLTYPYSIYFFGGVTIGESHDVVVRGNEIEVDRAAGIVVRNCCSAERDPSTGIMIEDNLVRSTNGGPVTVGLTDGYSSIDQIRYRNNRYEGNVQFYWNFEWYSLDRWLDSGQG